MNNFVGQLDEANKQVEEHEIETKVTWAKRQLLNLIQSEQYVGEVYSLGYETALVMIHDHHRREVGGIPSLSFLIATRIPNSFSDAAKNDHLKSFDYKLEDSSVILLRVMDAARLPSDDEALRIRVQSAQSISGEPGVHWDGSQAMDSKTHHLLSFAGVQCRVIGTFYLGNTDDNPIPQLKFGSDISNYYPNRGLKVYKPNEAALEAIVNYRTSDTEEVSDPVNIGHIRYASTNRNFQGVADVPFAIIPADFLDQKTALFGMTRTGKSNTTKVILQSVFELRFIDNNEPLRIGQIVFDPNGEYANENVQDGNQQRNPSAIKNVWHIHPRGVKDDVVTYGIMGHPNDPDRKLMLINFYDDAMLQVGKDLIDTLLESDNAKYIQNFRQVSLELPHKSDYEERQYQGILTRYYRRVLFYRALLNKAGFVVPPSLKPNMRSGRSSLFSKAILEKMAGVENKDKKKEGQIHRAAVALGKGSLSWDALAAAAEGLFYFIGTDDYDKFDQAYIKTSSTGESWADGDLIRILEMFNYRKGANMIGEVRNQHTEATNTDFAQDIYQDLVDGKLIIVDQSSGNPDVNEAAAKRIMQRIFSGNQALFREGKYPPHILVYVEEAHNLLPYGTDLDLKDVWVRSAKEGAKYHIGMVYITQEVSSIQRNILKNTANWFIGHLNNTDETKEIRKFYDFADFEGSILRAQDKGFLRVKTLSNPFVVPVQVKRFVMNISARSSRESGE